MLALSDPRYFPADDLAFLPSFPAAFLGTTVDIGHNYTDRRFLPILSVLSHSAAPYKQFGRRACVVRSRRGSRNRSESYSPPTSDCPPRKISTMPFLGVLAAFGH